jgi:hypothetical protein
VSRGDDPAPGEAETDPDRGELDAPTFGAAWPPGTRPRLRLRGEDPGLIDQALS